jgi:hypothetical protein
VGTQYTPPGYPPTYHTPAPTSAIANTTSTNTRDTVQASPLAALAITGTPRGTSSAASAATEPQEPALRVDPQLAHDAQQPGRRASVESTRSVVEQDAVPKEASAVHQVPASPAKRARQNEPGVRVMPLQYETCDVKDLGVLISDMLMELVRINDEQPLRDGTLTRFHSRYVPRNNVRYFAY